jgi:hypothetical protein
MSYFTEIQGAVVVVIIMLMVWFGLVNGVQHHFEQYFSYIVAITTTTAPGMLTENV